MAPPSLFLEGIPLLSHSPYTRSAWRRDRGAYVRQFMEAAESFLVSDADCPDWVHGGLVPAEWLAMTEDARRSHARRVAYGIWEAEYPMPPALPDLGQPRPTVGTPAPRTPAPAVSPAQARKLSVPIHYRADLVVIRDPDMARRRSLVVAGQAAPAGSVDRAPWAVAEPAPADPSPSPSPMSRAVVLCSACGSFVPARAGRAVVPAVGGKCKH